MRYAFHLKIKEGKELEYRKRHQNVWPEMIDLLKKSGVKNYSIFIEDQDVFGIWECEDVARTLRIINESDVNRKWQEYMSDIIITPSERRTGRGMEEVFYLP